MAFTVWLSCQYASQHEEEPVRRCQSALASIYRAVPLATETLPMDFRAGQRLPEPFFSSRRRLSRAVYVPSSTIFAWQRRASASCEPLIVFSSTTARSNYCQQWWPRLRQRPEREEKRSVHYSIQCARERGYIRCRLFFYDCVSLHLTSFLIEATR